jgi:hypothetical protein
MGCGGAGRARISGGVVLLGAMACALLAWAGAAAGSVFSGDPIADGWVLRGNSTTLGGNADNEADTTIHPLFNFDIYSRIFQVTPGDGLAGGAIHNGDTIIGVGAVMLGSFDLNKVQAKFGDGTSTFTPSSYVPGSVGHEHDTGDGVSGVTAAGPHGFLANLSGVTSWALAAPVIPTDTESSSTGSVPGYVPGGILFMSEAMTTGPLSSFEFILDVGAMGPGFGAIPQGGQFIITTQHETTPCNWTNALGATLDSSPEPATLTLLVLGGAALVARRRRRS